MPSEQAYKRALAYALNDLGVYPVAASTTTTVACNGLKNSVANASTTRYDGRWVYAATGTHAGQQERVKNGAYAPSTGTLTLASTWTALTPGDEVELTALFPSGDTGAIAVGEDVSYRVLINRALSRLSVPKRISFAITTSQSYDISAYPWLDRDERLVGLEEPGPTGGITIPAEWRRPSLRLDADTPFLEIEAPFGTGASGVLTAETLLPGDVWIKVGATWAFSTVGLVNDTDQAMPSVNDVVTVGLMEAYRALMHRSSSAPAGAWSGKFAAQLGECHKLKYWDHTQEIAAPAAAPVEAAAA